MKEEKLNIVVTGKSGVGKSSFLNYLIVKDKFETGRGDAVTQKYFECTSFRDEENDIKYNLFDTKGIEPNTTDECVRTIISEIEKYDQSPNIFNWIHTVYYCFAAPSRRVENFEIDFVKQLLSKGVSVVILLTKKDLVNANDLLSIRKQILAEIGDEVQVIPVCSVSERTRKTVSVKEGRPEVLKASFLGLWEKMALRLPSKYLEMFENLNPGFKDKDLMPKSESANEVYEFCKKINIDINQKFQNNIFKDGITLTCLRKFPSLNKLFYVDNLDSDSIKILRRLIHGTILAFSNLEEILNSEVIKKEWVANRDLIDKAFAFYERVNNYKPKYLYQHKAEEALNKMLKFDCNKELYQKLQTDRDKIYDWFDAIADCWLFDRSEKESATTAFTDFHSDVIHAATCFYNLLENFISAYKAELHQYGQYCIRKEVNETDAYYNGEIVSVIARKQIFCEVANAIKNRKINGIERTALVNDLLEILKLSMDGDNDLFDL